MERSAVITGIGVILPGIRTKEDLWASQSNSSCLFRQVSKNISGASIDPSEFKGEISGRTAIKIDVFTSYALIATQSAIADAGIDKEIIDRQRTGVFVGNCFGGWQFTERELRKLYLQGPRAVSPFQATSWFPTAPQGQITILHGLKGFSKTYMADRMSSLVSVAAAAAKIRSGIIDVAIAGGTESTNTGFIYAGLDFVPSAHGVDGSKHGFRISEGSTFLVLEEEEAARRRGARIYARIGAFSQANSPSKADRYTTDAHAFRRTMRSVIGNRQPEIVISDASGLDCVENAEREAIADIASKSIMARPKERIGHTFGAESAVDIAFGCLMLEKQQQSPHFIGQPVSIERIVINASAMGGGVASLIIEHGSAS